MNLTTIKATLIFMLLATTAQAAERLALPSKNTPPDYLFLVDTSASFEPYRETIKNKFYDLIDEGLDGRLKDGDTFTIWPFNQNVDTRTFPVIEWSNANKGQIAVQLYNYFSELHFSGADQWTPAQVEAFSAIKSLERLTVIIISDGFRKVEGTPYDDRINGVFQRHAGEFRRMGKPFITTLVGYKGKVVGAAVNTVSAKLHDPTPENLTEEAIALAAAKAEEERLAAQAEAAKKAEAAQIAKTPRVTSPVQISTATPKQISAPEPIGNTDNVAGPITASGRSASEATASAESVSSPQTVSAPAETPGAGALVAETHGSGPTAVVTTGPATRTGPLPEAQAQSLPVHEAKLSSPVSSPVSADGGYSQLFLAYGGAFLFVAGLLLFFLLLRFHRPRHHQPSIITQSFNQANR